MLTKLIISIGNPLYLLILVLLESLIGLTSISPNYHDEVDNKNADKDKIFDLIKKYYQDYHKKKSFIPGSTYIKASGAKYNHEEMVNLVDVALDFWLTEGVKTSLFSQKLCQFTGNQYASLTVSGSSANLLAFSALTSKKLNSRRIKPGDEVITAACGFPTTINPIIQNNAIPVFVDVDIATLNTSVKAIEAAITPKTKAIMLAHTLGFPFQVDQVKKLAQKHNLWLIEDSCDALGASISGKSVATFGDISTVSLFPAHQITTGEGGIIFTNNALLNRIINTFRDWGRDCWCKPGDDNTCQKRFAWKLGHMPLGYDHKYMYSEIGYNMRLTEMQSAIGLAQIDKLPAFVEARQKNFNHYRERLNKHDHFFIPIKLANKAIASPFGYVLNRRPTAPFTTVELIDYLESHKIATRRTFGGNLLRHPAYQNIKYRQVGDLKHSDHLLENAIWIGLHPSVSSEEIDYICDHIDLFLSHY